MSKVDKEMQELIKNYILIILDEKAFQMEFIDAITHQTDEQRQAEKELLKKARETINNIL